MDNLGKKEVIQAVVIADNFNENFSPITDDISAALLPIVNTTLLDFTLESLNRSNIEEVFVFSSVHTDQIKEHIKNAIKNKCSWSVSMVVNIIGSEGCRCLGDALRDLDAKGLIRGHFVLMGADTISNAQLGPILEEHKRISKFDKGTAMTVIYKETSVDARINDELVIGMDKESKRLLFHQKKKSQLKEKYITFPLELCSLNPEVIFHNDINDPQIAICGPSVLPLFADNFDFETRDDFIRGLLINEEILASTIYVSFLPREQYAAKVSDWKSYQLVSNDIINRWVYPIVPGMGILTLEQDYIFLRNNVYKGRNVHLARGGILKENVVINKNCVVSDKSIIKSSVIGNNCSIGKNCTLNYAYVFDNCIIEDDCLLEHCVIGDNGKILKNSKITEGAVIGFNVIIPENTNVEKHFVQSEDPDDENSIKLGDKAFTKNDVDEVCETDSDDDDIPIEIGRARIETLNRSCASSLYSSSSEENISRQISPIAEDGNIFLSEVIDSLTRGFEEKSNPEFLILEINSSRYAYNMTLNEVNYYVVRAILSLPPILEEGVNIVNALKSLLAQLGPVVNNYIRGDVAMRDCLKAVEDSCNENSTFKPKIAQIIHYLYDKEIVSEDAIMSWHEEIDDEESDWIKPLLAKLIAWLMESSEEEDDESDDE